MAENSVRAHDRHRERTPIEPSIAGLCTRQLSAKSSTQSIHHKEPSSVRGNSLQDFSLTQEYTSARGDSLRDLPGWFEDFTENLVGGRRIFTLRKRSSWSFGAMSSSSSTHGSIMCSHIFQRTRIARSAEGLKSEGFRAQSAQGITYREQKSLVTSSRPTIKSSTKRSNLAIITGML